MIPDNLRIPRIPAVALALGGLVLTVMVALVVGYVIWSGWSRPPKVFGLGEAPDQPIAFPHTVHVQDAKLDCQFCHRTVTESEQASIPAVQQCMFCHQVIGDGNPEVEKLRQFAKDQQPINWKRVHRLPDHVQFTHEAHIRFFTQQRGMETTQVCSICHGDVGSMVKLEQVRDLKMRDCVDCHRDNNAPTDCAICHY